MFVVPLYGDKILCNGKSYTVLGYTNYKDKPTVYCQGPKTETVNVAFSDISEINGTHVEPTTGKVFSASASTHKFELPQKDDKVTLKNRVIKVDSLKLNERGKLGSGMLVVGEDAETSEKVTIRLAELDGITRANGTHTNIDGFMRAYADYLGSRS